MDTDDDVSTFEEEEASISEVENEHFNPSLAPQGLYKFIIKI